MQPFSETALMYSYLVRAPRVFSLHLSWAFWLPDLWASLEKGAGVWFLNELLGESAL